MDKNVLYKYTSLFTLFVYHQMQVPQYLQQLNKNHVLHLKMILQMVNSFAHVPIGIIIMITITVDYPK